MKLSEIQKMAYRHCSVKNLQLLLQNSQENSGDGELHIVNDSISSAFLKMFRTLSLVVSDLRSETKSSRFRSGCYLCARVSSLQQSPG